MNQARQSYYIRESAVSTQPQGNSVLGSRNNSLVALTLHQQNSLSNNNNNNNNSSSNQIQIQQPKGQSSHHIKHSSTASNLSGIKNQYVINVTQDSSLMTVADVNNQRKSLSILASQQSQLKELFRNKAQTPTHHSSSNSHHHYNVPYLKDNYFLKNPDHQASQQSGLSRNKIAQNKFIPYTENNQNRRQSSSIIGQGNQSDIADNHQNINKSNSNLVMKIPDQNKLNQSLNNHYHYNSNNHYNHHHQNNNHNSTVNNTMNNNTNNNENTHNNNTNNKNGYSQINSFVQNNSQLSQLNKEQLNRQKLQRTFIDNLQKSDLVKQSEYKYDTFKSIIHNFMVNDALISNIDLPPPPPPLSFSDADNNNTSQSQSQSQLQQQQLQYQAQSSLCERIPTESSCSNNKSKSSRMIHQIQEEGSSNNTIAINDQHFITALKQEKLDSFQNKAQQSLYNHKNAQEVSLISNQQNVHSKVQFRTEQNMSTPLKAHNQDNNKITINIIDSKTDLNTPQHQQSYSTKAIHCEESELVKQNEQAKQSITDPTQVKSKEDLLMLLMDFLMIIEPQFKEGMNCKYYPSANFMQHFMKSILEISNKVCYYLMQSKEKVVSVFINTILKMIAQIFEKQYSYIKEEVKTKVEIQVSQVNGKFDYLVQKKAELEEKINQMYKEQDKMQEDFKRKALHMEEIKNQYLEQVEILKESIEESKTKKYKDFQLERIQIQSKEVIKNCAMIETELIKRKEESKDTIQSLAKMTFEHFSLIKNDVRRKSLLGNLGINGINNSDMIFGMNSNNQSENQPSFSEINMITYAQKYDKPESKAAILFSHPFSFYIQQDIQNYLYDKLVPKMTRSEMIKLLENFMEEVIQSHYKSFYF